MADALPANYAVANNKIAVAITAGDGFGGSGLGATAPPVNLATKVLC